MVFKIPTVHLPKRSEQSWDDPVATEKYMLQRGMAGTLPVLLAGAALYCDNNERYYFQCQPFADVTVESVFTSISKQPPGGNPKCINYLVFYSLLL